MSPFKFGSSEKDSNDRPPRGDLWVFTVGARRIWAPNEGLDQDGLLLIHIHLPFARHSSARASPTLYARSTSKEAPRPVLDGKQLDGTPLKTRRIWEHLIFRWMIIQS